MKRVLLPSRILRCVTFDQFSKKVWNRKKWWVPMHNQVKQKSKERKIKILAYLQIKHMLQIVTSEVFSQVLGLSVSHSNTMKLSFNYYSIKQKIIIHDKDTCRQVDAV